MISVPDYFHFCINHIVGINYNTVHYSLNKRQIEICFHTSFLEKSFHPSIAHLETSFSNNKFSELKIYCIDSSALESNLKFPDWPLEFFINGGYSEVLDSDRFKVFYPHDANRIFIYDHESNIGIVVYKNHKSIPWWEKTFPFRYVFHWWSKNINAQLIHSGAIELEENKAFLITGASGSGKSTTCLNLVQSGFNYLGDDYVWVEKNDDHWEVFCLYLTAKIIKENLFLRFKELYSHVNKKELVGDEKFVLYIDTIFPDQITHKSRIHGILLPEITNSKIAQFSNLGAIEALMAITPTTLFHLKHDRNVSFAKISSLCKEIESKKWKLSINDPDNVNSFKKLKHLF